VRTALIESTLCPRQDAVGNLQSVRPQSSHLKEDLELTTQVELDGGSAQAGWFQPPLGDPALIVNA